MPLPTGTTDVVEMPANCPAVHGHVEDMLRDTHGLYASMQDFL